MRRKILSLFLIFFILCLVVFTLVFIKISRHAQRTIVRLQKERGPHRVEMTEISLVRKKGWELFVDRGDVRDIVGFRSKYYLATSGGIVIIEEGGKVTRTLNTTWGLPENSYRQLLIGEDGVFALSEGGALVQIKEKNVFAYDLSLIGKASSMSGDGSTVFIGGDEGVFIFRDNELSVSEHVERVNIVRPFLNGFAAGTTDGTVYLSTSTETDSITGLDAVNDLWGRENVLHIATPLGVKKVRDDTVEDELRGEFITAIAEMEGKLFYGTFDGRVILDDKVERVTREDGHIRALKMVNGRLFACTNEGVYMLGEKGWQVFYRPREEIPLEYITTLLRTGGELLVGTFEDGCFSLKSENLYELKLGKGVNEINQIVYEGGSAFFATNSGLFEMDEKGVRKHEGLPSLFVNSITAYEKSIVAGTSNGFCIIDLSDLSVKNYGSFNGLINNRVYAVAVNEGEIVLGTLGGISIFDGSAFSSITSANSDMKSNWVTGLKEAQERIYIGTYGGGIGYLWEKGIHIVEETEGAEVNPNGMFYRKPLLFAGTCNEGLIVFDERSERASFLKGIFPRDNVTAVYVDDDFYYIGTTQGFYRIEAKEFSLL